MVRPEELPRADRETPAPVLAVNASPGGTPAALVPTRNRETPTTNPTTLAPAVVFRRPLDDHVAPDTSDRRSRFGYQNTGFVPRTETRADLSDTVRRRSRSPPAFPQRLAERAGTES
ncbi:MAG: hypothetical protein ABEI99_06200, partial [Halobaculum sp.]